MEGGPMSPWIEPPKARGHLRPTCLLVVASVTAALLGLSAQAAAAAPLAVHWTQRSPLVSPSPREGAATAYDPVHRQTVLFGGFDGANIRRQTSTWDGATNWTKQTPATAPSARLYAAMAWDSTHPQIVLVGGWDGANYPDDTRTRDGTNW